MSGSWITQVHRSCAHNEVQALKLRLLGSTLPPQVLQQVSLEVRREFDSLVKLARKYTGGRWSLEETAQSYSGLLRRRYTEAARSLTEDGGITARDAKIKAFMKVEKINVGPKWAKPRMICPRSPRYNLALASRLKPFEHWLWGRLSGKHLRRFRGDAGGQGRLVAKGLNPLQRGNLISRKFRSFKDCVVFEADGRAFEAHVGPDQLVQEQRVYSAAFPGDRGLSSLLRKQLNLEGRLSCGAKFSRPGGRASGDFNTGMGNTIIMLCVVVAVMKSFGVGFDLLVDGDNCLVFCERADLPVVLADFAPRAVAWSGQELVVERPVDVMEHIRFGQSAPVSVGGGRWMMVRDPRKVLSGATSSYKWLREPLFARTYLHGVSRCELSLALGMPVLQAWALHLMGVTSTMKKLKEHPFVDYFVLGGWFAGESDARPVLQETRESFERAFNISVEEQKEMESSYDYNADQVYAKKLAFTDWRQAEPGLMENWAEAQ